MLVRNASSVAAAESNVTTAEVMVKTEAEINKSNNSMGFTQAFRDASPAVARICGYHCLCNADGKVLRSQLTWEFSVPNQKQNQQDMEADIEIFVTSKFKARELLAACTTGRHGSARRYKDLLLML